MKKKNISYNRPVEQINSTSYGSVNLKDENRKLLEDALKTIMSNEQFKEQNAEAKEFFEKAVFKLDIKDVKSL